MKLPDINSAVEVKKMLKQGWELWYVHNRRYHPLPGHFEMRYQNKVATVTWECIEKCRKNLEWYRQNTEEVQYGNDWCYSYKQSDMLSPLMGEAAGGSA